MKKMFALFALLSTFTFAFAGLNCPLRVSVSMMNNNDDILSNGQKRQLEKQLVNSLNEKGYIAKVESVRTEKGDITARIKFGFDVVSSKNSCATSLELTEWINPQIASYDVLYSKDYSTWSPIIAKKKCLRMLEKFIRSIPDCSEL